MDVMRTGVSVLGTIEPEEEDHSVQRAKGVADRLMASLGSMLLYWHHFSRGRKRIEVETDDDSIGGPPPHPLHRKRPPAGLGRGMHTSLLLFPEHDVNTSALTCRVITGT